MYEWAELRHFKYLLTILERQGFRPAAEELRTAQPNLSVQARQFQENASVRLFRKMKGGRIRPTDTGVAFKVLAKFLLETRDEVIDALIAIERGEVDSVRFGWGAGWIGSSTFRRSPDGRGKRVPCFAGLGGAEVQRRANQREDGQESGVRGLSP
ncbi:LysR family transcriptional regulator [Granulicella sp. L60]|uniref:LysR family transcriptional regulator n=1 Tax=Granulicella sp. L60 TaxID=1641866 RepID=UPI0020B17200|nr:LysR family transcriptional regulator [Granulicella sp. L60]